MSDKELEVLEINKTVNDLSMNEDGQITAYLTTFGNLDVVNDVIMPGALDKFVEKFNNGEAGVLRMLFQHERMEIIGTWDKLEIDAKGVIGTGTLFADVSRGKDVKVLLKRGVLNAVSIGFKASKYEYNEFDGRDFHEIELTETSVVDTGANNQALIISVKNEDGGVNVRNLETVLRDAGLSRREAKQISSVAKKELNSVEPVVCDEQPDQMSLIADALTSFTLTKTEED